MHSRFVRALAAVLLISASAQSQCLDFASGFGPGANGLSGSAKALCAFDDGGGTRLYAGGTFSDLGNAAVARWNGASWTPVASGINTDQVRDLIVWNDGGGQKLYAGGAFMSINGIAAKRLAAWDGSVWAEVGGGLNGIVNSMTVHDFGSGPKLVVAGEFTLAGATTCKRAAMWDGAQWTALGSNLNGAIYGALSYNVSAGPQLFVTGAIPGVVNAWNGSSWTVVGSGLSATNSAMGLTGIALVGADLGQGPRLFAGGSMSLNGNYGHVVSWNGSTWSGVGLPSDVNAPYNVKSLAVHDFGTGPRLFAGGYFPYQAPFEVAANIAFFNASTWTRLAKGLVLTDTTQAVKDLLSFDDGTGSKLFIAGYFSSAGEYPSVNVARWGDPCQPPTITAQPQSASTKMTPTFVVNFTTSAVGAAPITYQWRKDGVPLAEQAPRVTGTTTNQLTILAWNLGDAGYYDCVASNALGSATSNTAELVIPLPPTGLPIQLTAAAVNGTQVANLPPGNTFVLARAPNVVGDDEFVFFADLSGSPSEARALCHYQNSQATLIHRSQQQAPGCEPQAVFGGLSAFTQFVAGSGGRTAFKDQLIGGTVPNGDFGIWFHDGSVTSLVAREGLPAAGCNPGETWRFFSAPVLGPGDAVAFTGVIRFNNVSTGVGLWLWDATNGPQLVARSGATAPGTSDVFKGFSLGQPVQFDAQGNLLMHGHRELPGQPQATTLWFGPPLAMQPFVQFGDPAPGFGPGATLDVIHGARRTSDGSVWFVAWVREANGNQSAAVYRWKQGILELGARRGDPGVEWDATSSFWSFTLLNANAAGDALVQIGLATACAPPCTTTAVYRLRIGAPPTLILANGQDPLVGAPAGSTLSQINHAAFSDLGEIAISCQLTYTGTGSSFVGQAAYGWTAQRGLFPIAIPGASLETSPGAYRTVSDCHMSPVHGGAGLAIGSAFTNTGRVALQLNLTSAPNGDIGIYIADFNYLQALQLGAGVNVCSGDGSGIPCPCANEGDAGEGCDNSTGLGGQLSVRGTNRVSAGDLEFDAIQMPADKSALLFQGSSLAGTGAGVPFRDGVRCVGTISKRFTVQQTRGSGTASWGPGLSTAGGWLSGTTHYFQVWYRDGAGSPCATFSNLTNALAVQFSP
ncbi:MAG: immunoglobulin domain-containing protein [Planctomycetes bacterium]|nr:immunoglobulin domain-containing protein [Planctomycetota bacterium]